MTDFELIVLGFFMGVFFSLIMIMAGVIYDTRINRDECKGDSDMRIYIPKRSGNRCGDNGCDKWNRREKE